MANKRLNAIISIGGAVSSSLKSAIGATQAGIGRIGDAVAKLQARSRELNAVIKQQEQLGRAGSAMRVQYAQQELALIDRRLAKLRQQQALESRISNAQRANVARRAELRGGIMDAVLVGATIGAPIAQAIKFENAMLGVAKQVEGARDKAGNLTPVYHEMGRAIQQLGREIPMATNSLAEMVTAGARMGVAKDQLIGFTRTAAMMAEAFEADPAELADNMGKIAGLYKIPIPAIGALADSINYLDDNAISKGKDIIEFLTRTGGVAGAVKVTGTQMAALGSTLLTLGERTETAGTATNAMFQKFAAADKGTKKFKSAMKEIGLSTSAIQKGMQVDAQGTIMKVLTAINKLPKDKQLGVMVELVGLEHSDTLAKLAGNLDEYRKQIALAHSEEAKGSMTREFQARLQTTGAQLKIASNRTTELAVDIGGALLPAINDGLGVLGPYITRLAELAKAHPGATKAIVGTVVGLGALKIGAMVGAYAFTFLKGGALALAGAAVRLLPALRMAGQAVLFLGRALLMNPIGLAVTAIGLAALVIYKYWEPIKSFFGEVWAFVKRVFIDANPPVQLAIGIFNGGVALISAAWTPLKEFFSGLWDGIKNVFSTSIDWIMGRVAVVFNAIDRIKAGASALFSGGGTGDSGPMEFDAMGNPTGMGPALPKPAMANRGAGGSFTDNSQTTFQITQQPGQDAKAVADEVDRLLKRRQAVEGRSKMYDGATR